MIYESLLKEAEQHEIYIYEKPMNSTIKGLYCDNIIWINCGVQTSAEKACTLAEELGHHNTSTGDILDQSLVENRKQEHKARSWAYEKLIPLTAFIDAHRTGIRNRHELADALNVTEEFLDYAIRHYQGKYGVFISVCGYTLCFEPLSVIEMFD